VTCLLTASSPSVTETDSATKVLTFTLTLDKAPATALVINYAVNSTSTAVLGDDFAVTAGNVTFAAGQTTAEIQVNVLADDADEANETIVLSFTNKDMVNSKLAVASVKRVNDLNATGTIIDDDASFVFTSSAANTVAENTTAVVTVAGADADSATGLTTTLSGADAALFSLTNGALAFKAAPNFEAPADAGANNVYNVSINVADASGNATTQNLVITVSDANEAPTALALTGQVASIAENTVLTASRKVADIVVTDDALGTEAFTLSGADAASFEIVGTELHLKAGTALNFEAKTAYNVTVSAADAALTGSTPVTAAYALAVTNVNEAPVAVADTAVVITGNSVTIPVLANDTDVDAGTTLAISGTPTASVGTVAVSGGQLVYTAPAGFQGAATISYSITDGAIVVPTTQLVSVGEPALSAAAASVNEGSPVVFNIKGVANTAYSVNLDFTNLNGAADRVDVVTTDASGNAQVTIATTVDRTTEGAQSVRANIVGTLAAPVSVSVADTSLNNVAPVATSATLAIAEGAAAVTGQLVATDADAADVANLTFSTASVVPGFTLNANGSYSFNATNAAYNTLAVGQTSVQTVAFTVNDNATTAGGGAKTATGTLTITVTGTNDVPTFTVAGGNAQNVAENTTAVTSFAIADVDATDTLSSVTLTGDDAALFQIVGNNLAFRTAPNFEVATDANRDGIYNVTLNVTDNNGGTAAQAVVVTVTDVVDAIGAVSDSNAAANSVAENSAVGTAVGVTALAVEPQTGDTVRYALTTNVNNLFAIDAVTGVVTVNGALNFETAASHSITVQATSSDGSTSNSNFTIAVTDVVESLNLTVGADTGTAFTGGAGADIFNALDVDVAGVAQTTWTTGDAIDGGLGNDVFNIIRNAAITTPLAATVTGIETLNATSANEITLNTTTFTGLTALNATTAEATAGAGTTVLTSAATTNVTLTGTVANTTAGALTVNGGNNVTVTGTGSPIVVGGTAATAPAGNVTVTSTAQAATNVAVNSGVNVNVTTTGQTTGTVIVGSALLPATGAVNVNVGGATTAATTGAVTVTGGSTITISDVVVNTGAAGAVAAVTGNIGATGSAVTTAVSVTQAPTVVAAAAVTALANTRDAVAAISGVTAAPVTVADLNAASVTLANTISSVTLNNYGDSTISSTALNTVNLSGTGGTLGITLGGSAATIAARTALNLNLGGGNLGVITDVANQLATVNAALTANTTLAGITDTALRTLNVSGTGVLSLTASNAALTGVNVTGAAGFNGTLVGTGVTSFTAANTTGNNTVTLTSTTQSYTGGSGNDTVSIAADATRTISGGTGNDTLVLSGTAATYTAPVTGANVTGFENLIVTNNAGGTYDLATLSGNTFGSVGVSGGGTNIFSNVAPGAAVNLNAASTAVTVTYDGIAGSANTTTVNLNGTPAVPANTTLGFITAALTLQDENGVSPGTVNVVSNASVGGGLHTITTLTASALSNLNITGTGSLSIGAAATTATALTISDNSAGTSLTANGIVALTSTGNVLGTLNFSGTHAYTIGTLTNNVANMTITNANTGATGVLTIGAHTDTNATFASLTLNGSIAYTGNFNAATGAATVNGATNHQNVSLTLNNATGAKTVTLGNGTNIVTTGGAADVITVGTGGNTITAGAGADTIVLGAGTAVSRIVIGATDSLNTALDTISGYTAGIDDLDLVTVPASLVASAGADFTTAVAVASTGVTAATLATNIATAVAAQIALAADNWAQLGDTMAVQITGASVAGNNVTYIVQNQAANATYDAAADTVIALIGTSTVPTALADFA
jgi:S-layer protein